MRKRIGQDEQDQSKEEVQEADDAMMKLYGRKAEAQRVRLGR